MDGNQDHGLGQRRFALAFEKMPVAWAEHRLVYDGEGNPIDYEILDVNPAFECFTGGGSLSFASAAGQGIRFTIQLPICGDE